MRASLSAILFVHWCAMAAVGTAGANDFSSLGYREDTVIESDGRDDCIGTLVYNHDYSFENGYCWQFHGVAPPYYGALAEAFDVGPVTIECGVYWLTQIGGYWPGPIDFYVWDGGVEGPPGNVLCVLPVSGLHAGFWPECNENDIEFDMCVDRDFTLGMWTDWDGSYCSYYICADENGPGGYPWTCIEPGMGYPSGWQHATVVWPDSKSMGIEAIVSSSPSPSEAETWGEIKGLFRSAVR